MDVTITERQAQILALVVREHVATAQPVASGTLVSRYGLQLSPATVRHELAALEDAGLLTHPHTSAGRVPTALGYRYFVEHLMSRARLSAPECQAIRGQFQEAEGDPERWLRLSAAVIAQTSGVAGLAASPPRLYHAGLMQILYQPEFADSGRLRGVVAILELGEGLDVILDELPASGACVIMGGEPPLERAPHVTMVVSRFGAPRQRHSGVVGVVGPTRLSYERAVPAVNFVAQLMTQLLAGEAVW